MIEKIVQTIAGPWNYRQAQKLKIRWRKAVENKEEKFTVPDRQGELLTDFAKYLVEYLETEFGEL